MPTFLYLTAHSIPNGIDYSGLPTSHSRIAQAYLTVANKAKIKKNLLKQKRKIISKGQNLTAFSDYLFQRKQDHP